MAKKMLFWLETMTHPDKQIAFFNDGALGIAPTLEQLKKYAEGLNIRPQPTKISAEKIGFLHLPQSGYIRLTTDDAVALLDVAEIGPDYQPGHAHADTLSFEFSLAGQRVLVNGGTSCYGVSDQRLSERQTRSHNTVEINGESSSEIWSAFRVARRARPENLHLSQGGDSVTVRCSHTGYRWLREKPQHIRTWTMESGCLTVEDKVIPSCPAIARFRFHPDMVVEKMATDLIRLKLPSTSEVRVQIADASWQLREGSYAQEFGVLMQAHILELSFDYEHATIRIYW